MRLQSITLNKWCFFITFNYEILSLWLFNRPNHHLATIVNNYELIVYLGMNLTNLFTSIRLLNGTISQQQVDSVNAILEACDKHGITDEHQVSYILATAYHEARFKPVREVGLGHGHSYGIPDKTTLQTYYGRGFVQLTWVSNYKTFGKILNIDLVNHPDLALQVDYAAEIIVVGMKNGLFTGKKLSNYFTGVTNDPVNARRIVNGLDKAQLIADYYTKILNGII